MTDYLTLRDGLVEFRTMPNRRDRKTDEAVNISTAEFMKINGYLCGLVALPSEGDDLDFVAYAIKLKEKNKLNKVRRILKQIDGGDDTAV